MKPEEYKQLQAYTRQDGFIMGVVWIVSFACFVNIFTSPALSLVFDVLIIGTPIALWYMAKRYRDKVIGGYMTFGRGFMYTLFICMYATILLCLAQWLYFAYMDNGTLFENMKSMFAMPEYTAMIKAYGIDQGELNTLIDQMKGARPIDIAFSMIGQSFSASLFMSLIIGFICKRRERRF